MNSPAGWASAEQIALVSRSRSLVLVDDVNRIRQWIRGTTHNARKMLDFLVTDNFAFDIDIKPA
jgi:hypothetical protein